MGYEGKWRFNLASFQLAQFHFGPNLAPEDIE